MLFPERCLKKSFQTKHFFCFFFLFKANHSSVFFFLSSRQITVCVNASNDFIIMNDANLSKPPLSLSLYS